MIIETKRPVASNRSRTQSTPCSEVLDSWPLQQLPLSASTTSPSSCRFQLLVSSFHFRFQLPASTATPSSYCFHFHFCHSGRLKSRQSTPECLEAVNFLPFPPLPPPPPTGVWKLWIFLPLPLPFVHLCRFRRFASSCRFQFPLRPLLLLSAASASASATICHFRFRHYLPLPLPPLSAASASASASVPLLPL